ncbi:uncharacterized protein UHO2_04152 [Ustilago hordei]|uniref:Reverse transcriptase Ty1/copia-type domain-containing protein n=1 Tax=Ustilago hordei TaxID=120017 RepID=I2FWP1_USTHO|nr:uncharacterized protein UHO2_04152 [Ustilago hordei]KAJ1573811.1 hypothetical protein NDA15_004411 [Ustilago hordei]CCF51334.1 uncharacterized protein UHOR_05279 [Ustilago hordei]SYW79509.1 uncharacterized protein UHO2_04152 [Ustilago hordei]
MTHTLLKAPPDSKVNEKLKNRYPTLVGKLLWIANMVRLDISFTINALAHHMFRPMEEAMKAVLQVILYLNQTQNEVLRLGGGDGNEPAITTYMDSNWALDLNTDRRSTSSSIVKVFDSVVTWNLHIQKCILESAVKVEYVTGLTTTHEALFHQHLLCRLSFRDHISLILTDNTGCIQVAKDQVLHSRLKHIDTKYHLIRNHVLEGDIIL